MKDLLITIDGPAGAGKTTVSRAIARKLSYTYVDTGALYRGLAVVADRKDIDPEDDAALEQVCKNLDLSLVTEADDTRVFADGEEITGFLRTPEVSMMASAVSARPLVREWLLGIQRDLGAGGKAVFEGRDMGTVVFPGADVKFFLHADDDVRAGRRHLELAEKGISSSPEEVASDMKKRDQNDSSRAVAPLKPAEDAISVDCTDMTVDEVVEFMLEHIRAKM